MGSDISLSKAVRANLLSLQNTAEMMNKTQSRLATGNKVNSALDNPSNFFTASALNSRAADMSNLLDSMASGIKVIEAADKGITAITKNIEQMQSTLRQARQDKSFQTDNYEVGKDSTLKLSGGQFDGEIEVKLQDPTDGAAASVSFDAIFADATASGDNRLGASTQIEYHASMADGGTINIDGRDVTFAAAGTNDADGVAAAINTALSNAGITGYTVEDDGTKIVIEQNDHTKASPKVQFGAGVDAAIYGKTSFTYDANYVGEVKVGSLTIATGGGDFDTFVKSLQDNAKEGKYTVTADATTKQISLTSTEPPPAGAPTVTGLVQAVDAVPASAAVSAVTTLNITDIGALITADNLELNGVAVDLAGPPPAGDGDEVAARVASALGGGATAVWAAGTAPAGTLTITYPAGAKAADDATFIDAGTGVTLDAANTSAGEAEGATTPAAPAIPGIKVTTTAPVAGAYATEVEAASHKFTVNYDGKKADINIVSRQPSELYGEEKQLARINDQLKAAGIYDVTASFEAVEGSDTDKKLVFTATNPEAKQLAISNDEGGLFGSKTVSIGSPAVSAYKSSNTVDQFVEEINRNPNTAGKVRASNDNGKLRIENLSTQKLDVEFDKDGAGVGTPTSHEIAGNVIRDNLAKQFNDLRDQLDKFADDSSFNGINLLRGDKLTITFNESGSSSIQIQAKDKNGNERPITAANLDLASLVGEDLDNDENIDALLTKLSTALGELRSQASTFGSNLSSVENRQSFTKNMINTLETGAANLTLADTNEEAANLLALQTRQQLSSSALSMASQQDQAVLQLLR